MDVIAIKKIFQNQVKLLDLGKTEGLEFLAVMVFFGSMRCNFLQKKKWISKRL